MNPELSYSNYLGMQSEQTLLTNVMDPQLNHSLREQEQYYASNMSPGNSQNPLPFNYIAQGGSPYGQQSGSPYSQPGATPFGQMSNEHSLRSMFALGYGANVYPAELEYRLDNRSGDLHQYQPAPEDKDNAADKLK